MIHMKSLDKNGQLIHSLARTNMSVIDWSPEFERN